MSPQTIQKLLKSKEGTELIAFIKEKIQSLDRCSNIRLTDDREIAVEVLARTRAAETLAEILKPILNYQEPTEPTSEQEPSIYYDHTININQKSNA